ncbi:hypothetical protein ACFL34_03975, partial [Candidatus Sumerlaeota bacterium]
RSEKQPANASVSVPFRGDWYYIDETDQYTKTVFLLLRSLWLFRTSDTSGAIQAAPVQTISVSR